MTTLWTEATQEATKQRQERLSITVDGKVSWPKVRARINQGPTFSDEEEETVLAAFNAAVKEVDDFLASEDWQAGATLLRKSGKIVEICAEFGPRWRVISLTALSPEGFYCIGKGKITTTELVQIVLHDWGGHFDDVDVDKIVTVIRNELDRIARQIKDPDLRPTGTMRSMWKDYRPFKKWVRPFIDLSAH